MSQHEVIILVLRERERESIKSEQYIYEFDQSCTYGLEGLHVVWKCTGVCR